MSILINVEDLLNKHKIESNRRLGDYLQELQLSEGRATGIPTIQDELRKNGSEPARIETDEGRTYFLIEIPCRDAHCRDSEAAGYKEKRIGGKNGSFCEDNITDIAEFL